MHVSTKGDYGLRALLDLAMRYGQGLVQSSEIAARQEIPEPYLNQLLTMLRKGGIITSRRGPQGGHMLVRPPEQITLEEVLMVLEGSTAPMECVENLEDCRFTSACALREVWLNVRQIVQGLLRSITIADLVQRQKQAESRIMYHI